MKFWNHNTKLYSKGVSQTWLNNYHKQNSLKTAQSRAHIQTYIYIILDYVRVIIKIADKDASRIEICDTCQATRYVFDIRITLANINNVMYL